MTLAFDGKRGALVASGRLTPENRKVASYLTALMLYSVTRR
jgi:hypothetical protein